MADNSANSAFDVGYLFSNFDEENGNITDDKDNYLVSMKAKMKNNENNENKEKEKKNSSKGSKKSIDNATAQYISQLEEQNEKLKVTIKRMIGPQMFSFYDSKSADNTSNVNGDIEQIEDEIQTKPFAIVLYLNNKVSTAHRKEIEDFMREISCKNSTPEVLLVPKLDAQGPAVPLQPFASSIRGRRFNLKNCTNPDELFITYACQYYKGFFIDRMGAPLLENDPSISDSFNIPSYAQIFMKALPILEESLNIRVKQLKRCFNCGGDHHLDDCQEPRDQEKIAANRQEFSASKFKSPAYQLQPVDEVDEKFKHFKAGEISVDLEQALGISLTKQLPPYIYKMRALGYPPGWVKPADDDGLKMYGSDGTALEEPGFEEGELKPIKIPDVIKYPGFNAPIPEGVEDAWREFNMPHFQPDLAVRDISRKRNEVLGFDENNPIAKKLKYDDNEEDMELEDNDDSDYEDGQQPPLPLIETSGDIYKPPLPSNDADTETSNSETTKEGGKKKKKRSKKGKKDKEIDETTHRNWFTDKPFTSVGMFVLYTPPPQCNKEVNFNDIPKSPCTDLNREPWKKTQVSWWDPLFGDLAAPTGTFDAIRTILKEQKREKRKPMKL